VAVVLLTDRAKALRRKVAEQTPRQRSPNEKHITLYRSVRVDGTSAFRACPMASTSQRLAELLMESVQPAMDQVLHHPRNNDVHLGRTRRRDGTAVGPSMILVFYPSKACINPPSRA
jgi:hypothetical protein